MMIIAKLNTPVINAVYKIAGWKMIPTTTNAATLLRIWRFKTRLYPVSPTGMKFQTGLR